MNPLYDALRRPSEPQTKFSLPTPRPIEFKAAEVDGAMPGQLVCVTVYAMVKSVDDEGRIFANVVKVEPEKEEKPTIIYKNSESHTP